jgi:hypothetical protein
MNQSYSLGKKKENQCFFSMIKPDSTLVLNNADVNELYFVQISGLWGSTSLLKITALSAALKLMAIA